MIKFLIISSLLWMPLVHAKPADELMDKLKAIKTFDAHFKQNIKDEGGKILNQSHGVIYVKRPGRFYWKSEYPDELLVVADGKLIWTYDIELEQIIKQDQSTSLGQSPAALLAGEVVDLDKEYDIVLLTPKRCNKSDTCYKLTPREDQGQFKSIKIGFNGAKLAMIHMKDGLEQSISTDFTQVKINTNFDDTFFEFTPPAGVDVIQGSQ